MSSAIVIVNYGTPDLTIGCLRSLACDHRTPGDVRVTIVDNSSPDDSAQLIRQAISQNGWHGWARVIEAERNGGFAFGNNLGIRDLLDATPGERPAHILLLNPDTIVRPGTVRALAAFLDANLQVGIVGSGIEDGDGKPQCTAHRFHSPLSELDRGAQLGVLSKLLHHVVVSPSSGGAPTQCDWVSGASIMIRREVFETVGLLDERFFLYFEEVDFCRRAKQAGWEVWCLPEVHVVHLEGQATGVRDLRKRRASYWFESRRRFFVTSYGVGGLVLADALWAVGRLSFAVRRLLQGKPSPDPRRFAVDLLWGDLKAVLGGEALRIHRSGVRP